MKSLILVIVILLAAVSMGAKKAPKQKSCRVGPIRIGVIDTGFGFNDLGVGAPLCKDGHTDFTGDRKYSSNYGTRALVPTDTHSHGTNVVGLIDQYASRGKNKYCFVILKYYLASNKGDKNLENSIAAFKFANNLNLDIINYSGGGSEFSEKEYLAIRSYLNNGGIVIAAAGNESKFLDGIQNSYYPAMYDKRITVVGNKDLYGNRIKSSNYGPYVSVWENGFQQMAYGIVMTGTSQATAVTTGKRVASMSSCDR